MKDWKKILALAVLICFAVSLVPVEANAEALTIAALGAAAVVVGVGAGIAISSSAGAKAWIESKLSTYTGGQSLTEYYGGAVIKSVAGKLVIPAIIYNDLKAFWQGIVQDNNITEQNPDNTLVVNGNVTMGQSNVNTIDLGNGLGFSTYLKEENSGANYEMWFYSYDNGYIYKLANTNSWPRQYNFAWTSGIKLKYEPSNQWIVGSIGYKIEDLENEVIKQQGILSAEMPLSKLSYTQITIGVDSTYPQYSDPDTNLSQSYQGDVGAPADTNLDQLIDTVYDDIEGGNLSVDGEVIQDEVIGPEPTTEPGPTTVPTYPPIDDVLGGLGEIGGTLDGINDTVGSIEQTLEGVGENVGELEQTITEALEVPNVEDIELHKFDLKGLFPFCIPFDLHAIISAFSTDPVTPSVSIPFNIPTIGLQYTFNLDLHDFDGLAQVLRTLEFIAFGVGLLFVTGKVIKW